MRRHAIDITIASLALAVSQNVVANPVAYFPFAGDTQDVSGNSNHGSFSGGLATFVTGHDGDAESALSFDGSDDYLDITHAAGLPLANSAAFSITGWVKGASGQSDRSVFCEASATDMAPIYSIGTHNTGADGTFGLFIRPDDNTPLVDHHHAPDAAFDGAWHHFALIDDGGTLSVYIDGALQAGSPTYTRGTLSADTTALGAILQGGASKHFAGALDDIRLYDHATAVHLVTNNTDSGSGSLRQAIADASSGDTILFDPALTGQKITLGGSQLVIDKDLVIDASALPGGITLDADELSRVMNIVSGNTVSVHSLTITGGSARDGEPGEDGEDGGGIYNAGTLAIHQTHILGNRAGDGAGNGDSGPIGHGGVGGGIANLGALAIYGSLISGNRGGDAYGGDGGAGGGIMSSGSLSIYHSTISANHAGHGFDGGFGGGSGGFGGGIASSGSNTIHDSKVSGNRAGDGFAGGDGGGGGGIFDNGMLTIHHSTISGNTAGGTANGDGGRGGGIISFNTLAIYNSTIANNRAGDGGGLGGGIWNSRALTIRQSTISDNRAGDGFHAGDGGGLFTIGSTATVLDQLTICKNLAGTSTNDGSLGKGGGLSSYFGDVTGLHNSIIAGNTGAAGTENLQNLGTLNQTGTNFLSGDPRLAPLGDYGGPTHTAPPLPGSGVIDAASGATTATTDQRGLARIVNATADVGAAEYQGAPDLAKFWLVDTDGDGSPYGVEKALGTDNFLPDAADPANPTLSTNSAGGNEITFSIDPAVAGITWIVRRSTDLSTFTEIYRFDGTTETSAANITSLKTGHSITVTDQMPPNPSAFYRFDAVLAP